MRIKKKKKIGKLSGTSVMCFIVCVPVHLNKKPQLHYAKLHHFYTFQAVSKAQVSDCAFVQFIRSNNSEVCFQDFIHIYTIYNLFNMHVTHLLRNITWHTHSPNTNMQRSKQTAWKQPPLPIRRNREPSVLGYLFPLNFTVKKWSLTSSLHSNAQNATMEISVSLNLLL